VGREREGWTHVRESIRVHEKRTSTCACQKEGRFVAVVVEEVRGADARYGRHRRVGGQGIQKGITDENHQQRTALVHHMSNRNERGGVSARRAKHDTKP
jgi:hypothetical protein